MMRYFRLARLMPASIAPAVVSIFFMHFAQRGLAQSLPDLVVNSIEVTPAQVFAGETEATIKVSWSNVGSGSVPVNQRLCLRLEINPSTGPWQDESCTFSGATPGFGTYKLFFPPIFPAQGGYFVSATIDSRSEVNESNNANNSLNYVVNVLVPDDTNPPPTPSLLSPGNGASVDDTTPFLDWSSVTDPEDNGTKYDVQVATSSAFSTLTRSASDLNGSGWTVSPALATNTYYWRVRAKDFLGNASNWTASRSFKIPAPPTLVVTQPAEDVEIPQGQPLTIIWDGTDLDSVALVSIGFDEDQVFDNGNHTWIALLQGEDGIFSWDTSGVPIGDYFIFGMISDGAATSYDFASGRVTVTDEAFPDLTATIQSLVPRTVAPGGKLVATTDFKNLGAVSAGPSNLRAYLSSNADPADFTGTALPVWIGAERPVELQTSAVEGIPANTTLNPRHLGFQIPSTMQSGGPYWLKVKIDSEGVIEETHNENNVSVSPSTVSVKQPTFGTTVLTHGWTPPGDCPIDWMYPMAEAIRRRAGKGQILFYSPNALNPALGLWTDSFAAGGNCETAYSPANNDPSGETVLIFNWIAESDRFANGWSEAAGDALFAALVQGWRAGEFPIASVHFIGHSRGTVVNSETVERLLDRGLGVDHVTNLDPHWWGLLNEISDDWDVNARHPEYPADLDEALPAPVITWAGVRSVDTYYQTDGVDLRGEAVPGGSNLDLSSAVDGIGHSEVHAWYYFTIDPDPAVGMDGDGIDFSSSWFTSGAGGCTGNRTSIYSRERDGFYFSRIGGTDGGYSACEAALTNPASPRFGDDDASPEAFTNGIRGDLGIAPESGWEEHGGQVQVVYPAGGVETPYLALREANELQHNRQLVPMNAVGLRFALRAEPNPACSDSPDDVVKVSLGRLIDLVGNPGEHSWTSFSSPACGLGWQYHLLEVPPGFRDRTTDGLRFDLERSGATLDHEVGVRAIEWIMGGTLPPTTNLLSNASFEQGTSGWTCNGCTHVREFGVVADGVESAFIDGRAASWAGPTQTITQLLENGGTYTISGLVRTKPSEVSVARFTFYLKSNDGADHVQYVSGPQASVSGTQFTQISGNVTLSWSGTLLDARVYVETSGNNASFYLDDVRLVRQGTTTTTHTLSVTTTGSGSGTVTSSPSGISCGTDCSESYSAAGTAVTLSAAAASGSTFAGWSGACSGSGSCQVTMDAAKTVSAAFNAPPAPTNLLSNPSFESGTTGWTCNNCVLVSQPGAVPHGQNAGYIHTRAASWAGPTYSLETEDLTNGKTYSISGFVQTARTSGSTARFTFYLNASPGGVKYVTGPQASVAYGQFTLISGTVTLQWSGTLNEARVYVETVGDSDPFYLDNVVLSEVP